MARDAEWTSYSLRARAFRFVRDAGQPGGTNVSCNSPATPEFQLEEDILTQILADRNYETYVALQHIDPGNLAVVSQRGTPRGSVRLPSPSFQLNDGRGVCQEGISCSPRGRNL